MGGFFVGSVSGITRLQIEGYSSDQVDPKLESFDEQIKKGAFRSIFPENAEKNIGFVSIYDCLDADLSPEKTLLGDYRAFSLRIDRRAIPASSLRIRILEETKKHLQETGQKRLYREQREAIKEAVSLELLKNIPPVTALYDVAINMVSGTVYVSFLTTKIIQEFMDIFKEAFGLSLQFRDAVGREDLEKSGLSLLTVGREFMTWLWFKSQQKDGWICLNREDYAVNFTRRIALESGEGESTETVVCSGRNFDLNEAKEALRQGKKIKEARIKIEKDAAAWEFGYKGDSFQFQSVKLPMSAEVEENETPDGRNLDRLFMVAAITETMDELFKMYLRLRVSSDWAAEFSAMLAWAEET